MSPAGAATSFPGVSLSQLTGSTAPTPTPQLTAPIQATTAVLKNGVCDCPTGSWLILSIGACITCPAGEEPNAAGKCPASPCPQGAAPNAAGVCVCQQQGWAPNGANGACMPANCPSDRVPTVNGCELVQQPVCGTPGKPNCPPSPGSPAPPSPAPAARPR